MRLEINVGKILDEIIKLGIISRREVELRVGVTKQTVNNWRKKSSIPSYALLLLPEILEYAGVMMIKIDDYKKGLRFAKQNTGTANAVLEQFYKLDVK